MSFVDILNDPITTESISTIPPLPLDKTYRGVIKSLDQKVVGDNKLVEAAIEIEHVVDAAGQLYPIRSVGFPLPSKTIKYAIWLEFDEGGKLDARNNLALGKIREATRLNSAGVQFRFQDLIGKAINLTVKMDSNNPEYQRVQNVMAIA